MPRHMQARERSHINVYLGDGAYAAFDGYDIWITAEDGMLASDAVCLDKHAVRVLTEFARRCYRKEDATEGESDG